MKLIRLILFLACFAPSLQEPLPLVVSAALSRYYTGLPWKPRTALAVAYLLHEPKVEVRAVAAGFSPSSFLTRHFGIHPCQAAENFLSDMGKAEIPVVCGAKTGFLGPDKVEKVLAKLMEGGAHWLVLDSWSAAAAVTLPSSGFRTQILSFLLPGPGLLYHENAVSHPLTQSFDEMSSPGLLLRSWQDSFKEALPRLKILGLAPGWRKVSLMGSNFHRCSGSWMHREFGRGQIAEVAYQQALRIARAISISSITASVEGMLQFFMPQDLASLHASLQDLASQERYLRLLVIGQIESRFSEGNPGLQ